MIIPIHIEGQPGGIHASDISMVLADTYNYKRAVVYTGSHPGGITVDESPVDILVAWDNALTLTEEENEE